MTEFVVLYVVEVEAPERGTRAKHHLAGRGKMKLADVEVARVKDFGVNDERLIVRTHLGAILRPGNRVLGYDLRNVNLNAEDDVMLQETKADVFLVKKIFSRKKNRAWELKRMDRDREDGAPDIDDDADLEAMKQELEEDPDLRRHVNMYKQNDGVKSKPVAAAVETPVDEDEEDDEEDANAPEVPLAELLEGLMLDGTD